MKITLLTFLTGVLVAWSAAAEPDAATSQPFQLTTNYGDTYLNCRVLKVTPETVTVMHEQGVTKIGLELLGPELQKKFNYDPVKAREYAKAEEAKLAKAHALKEKQDREAEAHMAALMAAEKKQLQAADQREQERLEAARAAATPSLPLAAMPGDPSPALGNAAPTPVTIQTEVVLPATSPVTQIYTPGTAQSQRYLFRDGGYYSPWNSGYGYGYGYVQPYSQGYYYSRPTLPCPPYGHQLRPAPISGTIRIGNGQVRINR